MSSPETNKEFMECLNKQMQRHEELFDKLIKALLSLSIIIFTVLIFLITPLISLLYPEKSSYNIPWYFEYFLLTLYLFIVLKSIFEYRKSISETSAILKDFKFIPIVWIEYSDKQKKINLSISFSLIPVLLATYIFPTNNLTKGLTLGIVLLYLSNAISIILVARKLDKAVIKNEHINLRKIKGVDAIQIVDIIFSLKFLIRAYRILPIEEFNKIDKRSLIISILTIIKDILDNPLSDRIILNTFDLAKDLTALLVNGDEYTSNKVLNLILNLYIKKLEPITFLKKMNQLLIKNLAVIKYTQFYSTIGETFKSIYEKFNIARDFIEPFSPLIFGFGILVIGKNLNISYLIGNIPTYILLPLLIIFFGNFLEFIGGKIMEKKSLILVAREMAIFILNCAEKFSDNIQESKSSNLIDNDL